MRIKKAMQISQQWVKAPEKEEKLRSGSKDMWHWSKKRILPTQDISGMSMSRIW